MLRLFVKQFENTEAQFEDLLLKNNWSEIAHYAHSISGVAGSLAADQVAMAARAVEEACEEGKGFDKTELTCLVRELTSAINVILVSLASLTVHPLQGQQ